MCVSFTTAGRGQQVSATEARPRPLRRHLPNAFGGKFCQAPAKKAQALADMPGFPTLSMIKDQQSKAGWGPTAAARESPGPRTRPTDSR